MSQQQKRFACKDVGYECAWHLEGNDEGEMLPIIERHAAEVHNISEFKEEAEQHVRDAIRRNSAA